MKAGTVAPAPSPAVPQRPVRRPAAVPTIVCVDDDLPMLSGLREQLMRGLSGACDVELASDGDEALQLLGELVDEGIDVPLIVSDHIMPGMRGAELLARVHRRYPKMLTILLTGQADVDAVGHAVNGANLYRLLMKPWHEQDMILTVKEALRRAAHERELAERSTALASSNERLEHSLQLLQATMDATLDGLLVLDRDGLPIVLNGQLVELWQVPPALGEIPGHGRALLEHVRGQLTDPSALRFGVDGEDDGDVPVVLELKDGRVVEVVSRAHRLHGERVGTVHSFRDVTERERSARLIRHQALHDNLSGLPNRLQFASALDKAIADARAKGGRLAVLFVDLDHFKRINDTLGHDFGDTVLKLTADRLAGCLREGDLIARWGGDEFTVLAPRIRSADEGSKLARRILDALDEPFKVGGMPLQMSASVGVATFPSDGDDGQALLRRADMALYRAKEEGRNGFKAFGQCAFGDTGARGDLSLENDLRRAIERGELALHYQPQFDSRSGRVIGVEALARWSHHERGWIGPDVFIPIGERTGTIVALGEWVLDAACRQAAQWRDDGFGDVRIAVNLSGVQFDRCDLQSVVRRSLDAHRLAPSALELEVTEAVALRHMGPTASTLAALQRDGIRIALDDFGTGYASLSYLKQLPCDTLKIDRTFIAGLRAGTKDAAIIQALVALADGLQLRLVAEGVETPEVAAVLQALGCWAMQGHLYCRAVPAHELTALLGRGGG